MESKEIYVVVATWTIGFGCGQKVRLFSTLEKAQKYMNDDIATAKKFYPFFNDEEIGKVSAYIAEDGFYARNHFEWSIDVEVVDRMNLEGGSSC